METFSENSINLYLIGGLFMFTGVMHFVKPRVFERIMPDYIPHHKAMVFWSGVFEVLGGIGIMIPFSRIFSAWGLIALLIAVFPANIDMFVKSVKRAPFLSLRTQITFWRLPVQFWLIYWVYVSAGL
ncbi:MAG TPA: hypothetical protein DEQ34_08600 [Balneolaceae bacterium]|nr:hypothetical protein [Balneolaceae bacterium]|tara:strand:- start:46 stop:426 length:381 start_codon:yes stop_codon:yes gene_type:complete